MSFGDALRYVVVAMSSLTFGLIVSVAYVYVRYRLREGAMLVHIVYIGAGFALLTLRMMVYQLEKAGDPFTPWVLVSIIGYVLASWGLYQLRKDGLERGKRGG
jgi:hypothetical protein